MAVQLQRWVSGLVRGMFTLLCWAVALYAFTYLYREFRTDDPFAAQFAISGWDVPAHFFAAGLALLLVPVQISPRVRRPQSCLHRLGGWLYVAAVLIGAASGLSLAMHAQGGNAARAGFLCLSLLWPVVTVIGIRRAIARDFVSHRQWMCRSIALTTGAITLRLILALGVVMHWPFMPVYVAAAWLSWPINLAICELMLRWPAILRHARSDIRSGSAAADA